jgi:hypothetical protein
MSKDLEIIKAEALLSKKMHEAQKSTGLDMSRSELRKDFELIARALNGEESAKFSALRSLVRRFGRWDAYQLILAASESSYDPWRILVRKRKHAEQPDQGRRAKRRDAEFRRNEIGLFYYDFRISGLSDQEAIRQTRKRLNLNLSDRTIKQELHLFRQAAKRRGYVDPYAATPGGLGPGHYREPKILVAELTRKGRPKKNIQRPQERNDLFPRFRSR